MNIYLKTREDKTVIDAYTSDEKKNSTDILYFENYVKDEDEKKKLNTLLNIKDVNGKYNNKYDVCFLEMTAEEKLNANMTENEKLFKEFEMVEKIKKFEEWKASRGDIK